MQVRLAFSIAIRAKTDVLVLDEVLAVGDEAFQRKCFEYFGSLKANKKTVILVTHDMASVERFCDRALLLEKGSIKFIGDKTEAAYLYNEQFLQEESARKSRENKKKFDTNAEKRDGRQRLESVSITQGADKDTTALKAGVDFTINFDVSSLEDVKDAVFGFHAYTSQGVLAFSVNTEERKVSVTLKKNKTVRLSFHIENIYTDDTYAISAAMVRKGKDGYLLHLMKFFEFSIGGTKYLRTSLTHPRTSIKIEELS